MSELEQILCDMKMLSKEEIEKWVKENNYPFPIKAAPDLSKTALALYERDKLQEQIDILVEALELAKEYENVLCGWDNFWIGSPDSRNGGANAEETIESYREYVKQNLPSTTEVLNRISWEVDGGIVSPIEQALAKVKQTTNDKE